MFVQKLADHLHDDIQATKIRPASPRMQLTHATAIRFATNVFIMTSFIINLIKPKLNNLNLIVKKNIN